MLRSLRGNLDEIFQGIHPIIVLDQIKGNRDNVPSLKSISPKTFIEKFKVQEFLLHWAALGCSNVKKPH